MNRFRYFPPCPGVLLLALLLLPGLSYGSGPPEAIAPEGVWHSRLSYSTQVQNAALNFHRDRAGLVDYLIRDDDLRAEVTGEIERRVERYDLLLAYGVSDRWNLFVNLPYLNLKQTSSLATDSTNPELVARVAQGQTDAVSGVGDMRLGSLHRPVFSDRNGFVWGYGLDVPAGEPERPYLDNTTFDVRNPLPGFFFLLHYTRYLSFQGGRWDIRAEGKYLEGGRVATAGGTEQSLQQGTRGIFSTGWGREFGLFGTGVDWEFSNKRPGTLAGQGLHDGEQAIRLRWHLDAGNMSLLEQRPVAFPFRVSLRAQTLLFGFNTPDGPGFTLDLQFFF